MTPDGPQKALDVQATVDAIMALEPESVAVCLLHAYRHPEHEQALGEALKDVPRQPLPPGRRHLPRVRARRDHRARRRPLPPARRLPAQPHAASAGQRPPGARRDAVQRRPGEPRAGRRPRRADRAQRPRGRRRRRRLGRPRGGRAGHAVLRHGRHELRRLRRARRRGARGERARDRRAPGRAADARHPHRRRRRRLDRLARRGRRAARRAAIGRRATRPRRLRPRRRGADGHRREPTCSACSAGSRAGSSSTARRRSRRSTRSASSSDLDRQETAEGIIRVANAEMVRALRVMTVERGVDPRKLALMAFGGAGGLHAAAIAEELGITKILCPRASGVLAALGLVVSERRRDAQRSVLLKADELTDEADELADRAREELARGRRRPDRRRAALPRPGVRARGRAERPPRGGFPPGARGGVRLP